VLAAVVVVALLAACRDDDTGTDGSNRPPTAPTDEATADTIAATTSRPTERAFPVTVRHEHGETEVAKAPERVATLGYSDQDFVLAFGVEPVAVTDWYGDDEFATWEWAQDELGDAEPVVLNKGAFTGTAAYNYEEIAELEPDLIIALYTDMSEQQ
jgi:iron complex transport system substrate-binding protein